MRHPLVHLLGKGWIGRHWKPDVLPIAPHVIGQTKGHRRGSAGCGLLGKLIVSTYLSFLLKYLSTKINKTPKAYQF